MKAIRVLVHLARADVLERVRRYGFLVVLCGTLYLGYAISRGDLYLRLGEYCGVLNAAWVGGMMTAMMVVWVSLFGFYIVKNTIERDMLTGVGQIIASCPVPGIGYLIGKWVSNWCVLATLVGILAVAALVMLVMGGELSGGDFIPLLSPIVLLALPAMACVAAVAVFFETMSFLRGGFGNVLYFFVWSVALSVPLVTMNVVLDWSGIVPVYQSMSGVLRRLDPSYTEGFNITWKAVEPGGLKTFIWTGVDWTTEILASRILWVAASAGLVCLGGLFFHRFDPSLERNGQKKRKKRIKHAETLAERGRSMNGETGSHSGKSRLGVAIDGARARLSAAASLIMPSGMFHGLSRTLLVRVLGAEVRVMVKGQRWWWYLGAAGLVFAGFVSSPDIARRYLLPASWLWPVLLLSMLGTREGRFGTSQLLSSSPHPVLRQTPAAWMAGALVMVLTGSGVGLNLLGSGLWPAFGAWCAGVLFVPSLALALGVWSQTNRVFEIVYLLLWYLGPVHPLDMPELDFMGAADASILSGAPVMFAVLGVVLLLLAMAGRWVRVRT